MKLIVLLTALLLCSVSAIDTGRRFREVILRRQAQGVLAPANDGQANDLFKSTSKLVVTETPSAWPGRPLATSQQCTGFKAKVEGQLKAAAKKSELIYGFLKAIAEGTNTITIQCANIKLDGSGQVVDNNAGGAMAVVTDSSVDTCASATDDFAKWYGCYNKYATTKSSDDVCAAIKALTSGGKPAKVILHFDLGFTPKITTTGKNAFKIFTKNKGAEVTKMICDSLNRENAPAGDGVLLVHELIHAQRIATGTYKGGCPWNDGNMDADDVAGWKEAATGVKCKTIGGGKCDAGMLGKVSKANILAGGSSAHSDDAEEFATTLGGGVKVGGKYLNENIARKELGDTSYRCLY